MIQILHIIHRQLQRLPVADGTHKLNTKEHLFLLSLYLISVLTSSKGCGWVGGDGLLNLNIVAAQLRLE